MTNAVTWAKIGVPLRRTIAALAGTAVAISSMAPTFAIAQTNLPSGGQVIAGSIGITQAGSTGLVLDQSSAAAIVNWEQFSIGAGHSVRINNAGGATLNRVTGASGTQIDGLLSGTGSVFVINPNGVIIGKSGVVETGGAFVASTLDVTDSDFLDGGDLTFRGDSSAQIVNMGRISSLS